MTRTLFGTDGIRATVGKEPLSVENLHCLGKAIALWAQEQYGTQPRIVIAHDTRASCEWIKATMQSGLLLFPVIIHDAHTLPTPALYAITQQHGFDCGIMISASHNPHEDNGIKIIDARHGKLRLEQEQRITTLFYEQQTKPPAYATFGTRADLDTAAELYCNSVLSFFPTPFLHNRTIVIDCANGATYALAPQLLAQLGARVITLHAQPHGTNINNNCGALYPHDLQRAVIEHNADAGFAFDGDGDRVIAVNKLGQVKDGDDIIALLLENPAFANTHTVVGTIMSNQGFEAYLTTLGKSLLRTAVGDKYVVESMEQHKVMLGGEQSGHIIMRDYLETGDGIFTALRVLQTLTLTNNWDMHTFAKYPQILINVPVAIKKDLTSTAIATLITAAQSQLHCGRLLVRYSGTENLLRIMIEDDSLEHANEIGNLLSIALQEALQ